MESLFHFPVIHQVKEVLQISGWRADGQPDWKSIFECVKISRRRPHHDQVTTPSDVFCHVWRFLGAVTLCDCPYCDARCTSETFQKTRTSVTVSADKSGSASLREKKSLSHNQPVYNHNPWDLKILFAGGRCSEVTFIKLFLHPLIRNHNWWMDVAGKYLLIWAHRLLRFDCSFWN